MASTESFQALIKGYTAQASYVAIGKKLRSGQFQAMKGYVSSIVQGLESHGNKLGYASLH
jgi:hypothetical protein